MKIILISVCFSCFIFGSAFAQLEFIQNKGQWESQVKYKSELSAGAFFLENKGFSVVLHQPDDMEALHKSVHGEIDPKTMFFKNPENFTIRSHCYRVSFFGASQPSSIIEEKPLNTYNNYYTSNNPQKWASGCKLLGAVTYKNVYPNIDVRYYNEGSTIKYDILVWPGGNVNAVRMVYEGLNNMKIESGNLLLQTSVGTLIEKAPYAYQSNLKSNDEVTVKYQLEENQIVRFKVGNYDKNRLLVIDPQIIFSSFVGSRADNYGFTATPGANGTFYAGGIVFGMGYRVSTGAFQTTFGGGITEGSTSGYDVGIFKFNSDGSNRLYATYLGGSGNEQPHSLIVDESDNLIVAGRTNSINFPVRTGVGGGGSGYDIFITKFNATGTQLIGSIKVGGSGDDGVNIQSKFLSSGRSSLRANYGDDARSEVITDAAGNIILASCTQSSDFSLLKGATAVQNTKGGKQDGVIMKLTPNLQTLIFGTYFGGSDDDACFVTSIDPKTGNIYVAGGTKSGDLRGSTINTVGQNAQGSEDGFITILSPNGTNILKTTYLGTTSLDIIYGLKFDKSGFPYVMGITYSDNWPIINAAYSVPKGKQFIAKLLPDLSNYVYSTTFGKSTSTSNDISPVAFLVDKCENVYVSGWGGGINVSANYSSGNTSGLPEVNPLSGIPAADGRDFYFFVLEKNAASILFASHFGQNGGFGDHVDGGTSRFDAKGIIYQAICANCGGGADFPTTRGAWAIYNGTGRINTGCDEVAVKIDMDYGGVDVGLSTVINGRIKQTRGCIPLKVFFYDELGEGTSYDWDFGDPRSPFNTQTTTNNYNEFTYDSVGTYLVRLIVKNTSKCNIQDTAFITIRVGDNKVTPSFTWEKLPPCTSTEVLFTNTSKPDTSINKYNDQSFTWDFGDLSPYLNTNYNPPRRHPYAQPGSYHVSLTLQDTTYCNVLDSFSRTLRIFPNVKAQMSTDTVGCVPHTAVFSNNSIAGLSYSWDFGDPASGAANTSTEFDPTHIYNQVGKYTVTLIVYDSGTCNKEDKTHFDIRVYPVPTAIISNWQPNPPIVNTPVSFSNGSIGAVRYFWDFGDGESSTAFEPVHEYNQTDTYTATLIATNTAGCKDTAFTYPRVIVDPLLDVPNAFTPGKFGTNSVIKVRGFGIAKMHWRIYNRWGQLVFESTNKNNGWDGTYKGTLQPADVYTYTLAVELVDKRIIKKTGDITLLR